MDVLNLKGLTLQDLINSINKSQEASVRRFSDQRPRMAQRIVLDLSTEKTAQDPFVVSNPFNGFYVETASDSNTNVKLSFGSLDSYSTENYTTVKLKDQAFSPLEVKQAVLTWPAQSGKTLTIVFYLGIEYRSGSLVSVNSGGVTISEGSSLDSNLLSGGVALVSVLTTATKILDASTTRNVALLYFDADVWVGDASVAVGTRGEYVPMGSYKFMNTAALYAISAVGSPVNCTGNVGSN